MEQNISKVAPNHAEMVKRPLCVAPPSSPPCADEVKLVDSALKGDASSGEAAAPAPASYSPRKSCVPEQVAALPLPVAFGRHTLSEDRFLLTRVLGKGGFGVVAEAREVALQRLVAIKMERAVGHRESPHHSYLYREYIAIKAVWDYFNHRHRHGPPLPPTVHKDRLCIPTLYYYGGDHDIRFIVCNVLGESLDAARRRYGHLSCRAVSMIGFSVLKALEVVHAAGFVHGDLKPENFLLGREDRDNVYLIDFGLSSRYLDADTNTHVPVKTNYPFQGTVRYASANAHRGLSPSRRDDLEQLLYSLIYMYCGRLPWTGLQIADAATQERRIGWMKATMDPEAVTRSCPVEMLQMLRYVRGMSFDETPDYAYLQELLRTMVTSTERVG